MKLSLSYINSDKMDEASLVGRTIRINDIQIYYPIPLYNIKIDIMDGYYTDNSIVIKRGYMYTSTSEYTVRDMIIQVDNYTLTIKGILCTRVFCEDINSVIQDEKFTTQWLFDIINNALGIIINVQNVGPFGI